jgi:hypothetical protein
MKLAFRPSVLMPVLGLLVVCALAQKEFLTPAEITKIQDAQEVEKRIKIYLDAAELRLRAAEERLNGQEAAEGDPMEFFTVEDMLDGYFQILRSVMLNLDDATQKKNIDQEKLTKALKNLKDTTGKATRSLEILKKMAEEKKLEKVWNLTNQAIDINRGANEGATMALASRPAEPGKKKKM